MKPINLNARRKEKARADKKSRADANAVKFGRTKAERVAEAARQRDDARRLSGHKIDDAD